MSKYDMAVERDVKKRIAAVDNWDVEKLKSIADILGYELRKKGVRRKKHREEDAEGNAIRNTYMPHVTVTAECYARCWKLYKDAQKLWGNGDAPIGDVIERRLLLAGEHVVRYLKHDIAEPAMVAAIQRLINPLPKREYLKKGKSK